MIFLENKLREIPSRTQLLLVAEALLLPSMLQKIDQVSFFVLGELLHQSLQAEDDGSASFLLDAGEELLYVLEDPIHTQVCLRLLELTLYFQQDKQRIARCDYCWGWFIPILMYSS